MEPVQDRAEVLEELYRGQTDYEDWLPNDPDLQTGDVDPDEDEGI